MARLVTSGFELGSWPTDDQSVVVGAFQPDGIASTANGGATAVETAVVRSGTQSLRCQGVAAAQVIAKVAFIRSSFLALGTTVFARAYFKFTGTPSQDYAIFEFTTHGSVVPCQVRLTTTGTLQLFKNVAGVTSQVGSDSSALSANTWYRLEASAMIGTAATDALELRLDGVSVASASGLSLTDDLIEDVGFGWTFPTGTSNTLGAVDLIFDDVAINDSSGATQNSWPGAGSVVLLKPTADSAKGLGWTNDAGSSTSLFPSVVNTPPVGIADTVVGSGIHQIRNATANANSNYDATLTTYTAAGIGASDTINVLQPIVSTGAPVSTSAKAGTVGIVSNPAIANVSLSAQGTSGAFWSGVAAGAWGVGWKWSWGTSTYSPTVTNGTAPVARITQVTSSTRIAMVAFLGMYVEYLPAATTVTPPHPTIISQATKRAASW